MKEDFSRWERAKIKAHIKKNAALFELEDQLTIDAKIEVENLCNDTDHNYIVERLLTKKPNIANILWYYLFNE